MTTPQKILKKRFSSVSLNFIKGQKSAGHNTEYIDGQSFPLGASLYNDGVNFVIFSPKASSMELLLFDDPDAEPTRTIKLCGDSNKTFYYWHVFVFEIGDGQFYGWRADGNRNELFDSSKVLLDPYADAVYLGKNYSRDDAKVFGT